jgi:hypothetical protein
MKVLRDNGLTIVLMLLFLVSIVGQWLMGWHFENEELALHNQPQIGLGEFATNPLFLSTVFENWESEFLQMAVYVVFTCFLFQKGSAESKDPDEPPRDDNLAEQAKKPDAPGVLRMGRMARALYAQSLGIALGVLFILSFLLHWIFSARHAAAEAIDHGAAPPTLLEYLTDAQLWFESFQNWQSEFLSTAVLIVLSIWLRQRGSPESKAVAAPHGQTGAD